MKSAALLMGMSIAAITSGGKMDPGFRRGDIAGATMQQTDSATMTYEINGLRIIHHQRSTSDIVAANLYLLGGSRQHTVENAGTEAFLLSASRYGTRAYPGEATTRALALTGGVIVVDPDYDWTQYSFHGLATEFDSTWAVFADRLMHPSLDSNAIAHTRTRFLSNLASRTESPDGHSFLLATESMYRNHPYAANPGGSEQSVKAITAESLRQYLSSQMMTSRMLLVVVGNVPRAKVEQAVTRTLGTLPRGNYSWTQPPALAPSSPSVSAAHRVLPTNWIRGYFAGPQRASSDYAAFDFAMQALSGWISSAVRGTGGLSYAAGVVLIGQGATGGQIFVSTTRPDSVMKLMGGQIDTLGKEVVFPRFILTEVANSYTSSYTRMLESSAQYADLLARSQLYNGDHRAAAQYRDQLRRVVGSDLKNMVMRYVKNIQWAYVGDTTKLPRELMMRRE